MFAPKDAEVLVVGAGPVGMIAALALDNLGIDVMLIDKDEGPATHSYACVLHSRTVEVLKRLDVGAEATNRGLTLSRLALYLGEKRSAELDLAALPGSSPFVLVLPQNELEEILATELVRRGVTIQWHNRLADLAASADDVRVTLQYLSDTGKGYAVPHLDQVVGRTRGATSAFLIGADGRDSSVRQHLGIEFRTIKPVDCYEMCDFACSEANDEIRIVFDNSTVSAFTPLPDGRGRWIFQVHPEELSWEAHLKDRHHFRIVSPTLDDETQKRVHGYVGTRAPWFKTAFNELEWHSIIDFPARVVRQFGRGRCWLLGDAAHLTSPIGAQSMNVGMQQAFQLAEVISSIVRQNAPMDLLETFNSASRSEWDRLLDGELPSIRGGSNPWAGAMSKHLVRSIPASGEDLGFLLRQVGLEFLPENRIEKQAALF